MLKLIFVDLDNTLLNSQKTVSFKTASFIKELEKQGIKFIINTGRVIYGVEPLKDFVDISNVISGNGAYVRINNELVYNRPLLNDDGLRLIEYAKKLNVVPCASFIDNLYTYGYLPTLPGFKPIVLSEDDFLNRIKNDDTYKICFLCEDREILSKINEFINNELKEAIGEYSNYRFLECHHKDTCKGAGIDRVCQALNVKKDEVLAIGDNENDLSMFNRGYHSACPANGSKNVKNIVEYISKYDNDSDAIIDIVKHFM